jgi:hypothetical protein
MDQMKARESNRKQDEETEGKKKQHGATERNIVQR